MIKILKKLARIILKEEIKQDKELIKRLIGYSVKHVPELKDDGTDQAYNLQYRIDVGHGFIPPGEYSIESHIIIGDESILRGKK